MHNKISCLIVGDTDSHLAEFAKAIDPQSYLVTAKNCHMTHVGSVYTSLGNLDSIEQFYTLLCRSNKIIVHNNKKTWSDKKNASQRYSLAWLTLHYCALVSTQFDIELQCDFDTKKLVDVPIERLGDQSQIWIAGCSTTYGDGVEPHQIYWRSVVAYLALPWICLARPGSSVSWSADQLLRSDLQAGDVILWGITNSARFYWYSNDHSSMINDHFYTVYPNFANVVPRFIVADDHWALESIIAVERVRNMCEKIGVLLLLVGIHADLDFTSHWINYTNFIPIHGRTGLHFDSEFEDFGTDNLHPGPKTHAKYSKLIIEHLNKIKHCKNVA